jgi:hypothetical protein
MKVRITERQYKLLENNISYDSNYIDDLLKAASKDLEDVKNKYKVAFNYAMSISINEIYENVSILNNKKKDLENFIKIMNKRNGKYYDVANSYNFNEQPDNVSKLDLLSSEIDNELIDLGYIEDIYEDLIEIVEKLKTKPLPNVDIEI